METEEVKLQALQKLLYNISPREEGEIVESDYNQLHKAFRVIAREQNDFSIQYISKRINVALKSHLKDQPVGDPFRVCSVGCGDGKRDCGILREALKTISNTVAFHFVGIDIDETSSRNAELAFKELSSINTTILNKDILKVDSVTLPKFDLVYLNYVHYYIKDLKSLVKMLKQLAKGETGIVLIVSGNRTPLRNLTKLFFEKEYNFPYRLSEDLLIGLDEMGVKYQAEALQDGVFNLDCCFTEGFSSNFSRDVLDFLTRTHLRRYPEEVTKAVVEYIQAISRKSPDKGYVCDFCDTAITLEF